MSSGFSFPFAMDDDDPFYSTFGEFHGEDDEAALDDLPSPSGSAQITPAPPVLSLAAAAEIAEIAPVTSATRMRDLSFSLSGTNSPIQRLPVELLHEIFLACLPSAEYTPASRRLAPLVVSWVCASWRAVALSLPSLWSSLALDPGARSLRPSEHCTYLSHSRFWLARAARRPLSLSVNAPAIAFNGKGWSSPGQDCTTFLTVEGYMQRCTKLALHVPISLRQLLQLLRHAFLLTSATFTDVSAHPDDSHALIEVENLKVLDITTHTTPALLFRRLVLPSLRRLAIRDVHAHPSAWPALTALLERSACALDAFSYTTGSQLPADAAFLRHPALQGLRSLVLGGFLVGRETLGPLGGADVMPLLAELELGVCVSGDGELAAMVAARCVSAAYPDAALRSIVVQLDDADAHAVDVTRLNALAAGGLRVDIQKLG
ncbi:hypothetical protein DFH09DRAFT_1363928 [Mycena vulgaris]|nr:hypothetical protein DFH09DRAFT_1363928 [Mycena vulgaris]